MVVKREWREKKRCIKLQKSGKMWKIYCKFIVKNGLRLENVLKWQYKVQTLGKKVASEY
jgi:hypothetical protein